VSIPSYDVVLVKWIDAHSVDGWTALHELTDPPVVITVGVVVKETDGALYVSGSFGCYDAPEDEEVATTMVIPKGMIKSKTIIRKNICGKRSQGRLHPKPAPEAIHREPSNG
jgi:hypothetical protein